VWWWLSFCCCVNLRSVLKLTAFFLSFACLDFERIVQIYVCCSADSYSCHLFCLSSYRNAINALLAGLSVCLIGLILLCVALYA
jgi:hypothetical protein